MAQKIEQLTMEMDQVLQQKSGPTKKVQGFLFGNLVKGGVWDSIFLIL